MDCSVIVPVHNEAAQIREFVTGFARTLPSGLRETLGEIILVENGSGDESLSECEAVKQELGGLVRVLVNPVAGYGEAIRRGMMEARGTHLTILECDCMDADFLAESVRLFEHEGARFIVASKHRRDSVDRRPWKRRLLSSVFHKTVNAATGYRGTDTHGLKSIETELAQKLCGLAVTGGEVFQAEIVLLAWKLGVPIREVPLRIEEKRPTPVALWKRLPKVVGTIRDLRRSLRRFDRGEA
ncbi:MAG TPA: glycosyltransferase family 2 protein [Bryobacteraceae bacterium]|nr:glycosyltransferase family 2 protein [Bryobacteraceae bacterium]